MEFLPHTFGGWMQLLVYLFCVVNPGLFLLRHTFFNRYAGGSGRMIAGFGAMVVFAMMDAVFPKVLVGLVDLQGGPVADLYTGTVEVPGSVAIALAAAGCFLAYWGTHSSRFVTQGNLERRKQDQCDVEEEFRERSAFVPRGTLMNMRVSRLPGGFLIPPDTLTEIETTECIVVVEGEVGTAEKGATVSGDGNGRIRIEGIRGTLQLRTR